jgi:vacuolar-type H+-ATPase subunit H
MSMHVPGTEQRTDLRVVHDEPPQVSGGPDQAIGLLENARRVADATVAEARDEAERLLAAARERAQQVQRDARELGQRLRADAEREAAQVRHQAFGEAERIVADARTQVSQLEGSLAGLRTERDRTTAAARALRDRLAALLDEDAAAGP